MVDWAAPPASRSSPRARAPSTCRRITRRRPPRCGPTTASARRWSRPATSTRRCSTRSSTAPRARSRWRRWPTRRASPAPDGLAFPPCGVDDLPRVLRPRDEGGMLAHAGQVEVISSLERDGRAGVPRPALGRVRDVPRRRAAGEDTCAAASGSTASRPIRRGRYAAMYKPYHAIGLELGISVASAGLRGEPTGQPRAFDADVVATAKRALGRARRSTAKAATRCTAS